MDSQPKKKYTPEFVQLIAERITGCKGSIALNRFAKSLVIGAAKEKGFEDKQNDSLSAVYERPYVVLGYFNVLTRFAAISDSGRFKWDFASGVTEGKKLSGYASSKGRHSQWVGEGAEKLWKEQNISAVVLIGFADGDIRFFYVSREEFLKIGEDRLSFKATDDQLTIWEKAWADLQFQPTFESLFTPKGE